MINIKTLAVGLAVVVALSVTSVRASLVTDGDPISIGSWAQGFNESGVGDFTQLETIFRSGPGGPFESPGFSSLANGWTVGVFNADHVIATGPAMNNLTWNIDFAGSISDTFVFDFYAWNGNTSLEQVRATWNNGWSFVVGNGVGGATLLSAPTPVPEPTTMIAGALLLLPFGASAIRILRKNRAA